MTTSQDILDFWFEGVTDATPIENKANPFRKWFMKNPKFDQEIRTKFEVDLVTAQQGGYKSWEESARGRLALIILFDQFSRNIYRNTPEAFVFDPLALDLTLRSLREGSDQSLYLIERTFFYMPLMHAEDLAVQETSVQYFEKLLQESRQKKTANASYYEYSLGFAQRHQEIIRRFGRFPHRNAILQRPSTEAEEQFLHKPASSF